MEYQVHLDAFRGPLDLLLFLVKRQEVDIRDIPIARVAEQFLEYLRVIELIDVELAGEFLVMAAALMEIKSSMLLPRGSAAGEDEVDPRQELVRQLLEYRQFKDAAALLDLQAERQLSRVARHPEGPPSAPDPAVQPVRTVELWDLVSAFGRLMRETLSLQPQQIVVDETPIQVYEDQIIGLLTAQPVLPFTAVFTPPRSRGRLVGLFLAILELIKTRRIVAEQPEGFGEMWFRVAAENTTPSA
jgi:segregation and condensation protein A